MTSLTAISQLHIFTDKKYENIFDNFAAFCLLNAPNYLPFDHSLIWLV